MASKLKAKPNPIKRAINGLKPTAIFVDEQRSRFPAGHFTAYGLFKGPEGMWILRVMQVEEDKIVSFRDNEPDIRAIQVGKIAMAMEGTEA